MGCDRAVPEIETQEMHVMSVELPEVMLAPTTSLAGLPGREVAAKVARAIRPREPAVDPLADRRSRDPGPPGYLAVVEAPAV